MALEHLCNGIVNELSEPVDRNPVILVLDTDVQVSNMISLLFVISSVIKKVFLAQRYSFDGCSALRISCWKG